MLQNEVENCMDEIVMDPVKNWSDPLRLADVFDDLRRPPLNVGIVYKVIAPINRNWEVIRIGSAHKTCNTDGRNRVGVMVAKILGFDTVWYSGDFSCLDASIVRHILVLWASVQGCPIDTERDLWRHYIRVLGEGSLFKKINPGLPRKNCKKFCN